MAGKDIFIASLLSFYMLWNVWEFNVLEFLKSISRQYFQICRLKNKKSPSRFHFFDFGKDATGRRLPTGFQNSRMEPKFQSSHPAAADDDVLWKLNKNSIKNSHAQHREALSRGSFIGFFYGTFCLKQKCVKIEAFETYSICVALNKSPGLPHVC